MKGKPATTRMKKLPQEQTARGQERVNNITEQSHKVRNETQVFFPQAQGSFQGTQLLPHIICALVINVQ